MTQFDESKLWHRRFGHINYDNLIKISKNKNVKNPPTLSKPENVVCKECHEGKQARISFKIKEYTSTRPLQLIQTNLCVPTRTKSLNGDRYFMFFVDDYTHMTWVTFLKYKVEAFSIFKIFRKW